MCPTSGRSRTKRMNTPRIHDAERVDWVDYAKGFCIVMVVMMHSTIGVEQAADRVVAHFAYFYALWVTIQFAFKAPVFAGQYGWLGVAYLYLESFVEPFGTLWFIYLLPIFFVVTKTARAFRVPPILVWLVLAALEIAPVDTGWTA